MDSHRESAPGGRFMPEAGVRAIALLHIGDVEGEVAGGEGLAVDRGWLFTRVVKDGEELHAVLVQELAA